MHATAERNERDGGAVPKLTMVDRGIEKVMFGELLGRLLY
jgi:hypothetical protein